MKNKVLASLVILKIFILVTWLFTNVSSYSAGDAEAGIPPRHEARPADVVKKDNSSTHDKGLLMALRRKEDELRRREDELVERKRHLADIRGDIDTRVKELKSLVKKLNFLKGEIESFNDGRIKHLVKIYENMAPRDAATRIEHLDDEMAASILGGMKEKVAGKILGLVNVDKSVRISRVLKKELR